MSIDLGGQLHEQDARGKPQLYEGRKMRIGGEGTIPIELDESSRGAAGLDYQENWERVRSVITIPALGMNLPQEFSQLEIPVVLEARTHASAGGIPL